MKKSRLLSFTCALGALFVAISCQGPVSGIDPASSLEDQARAIASSYVDAKLSLYSDPSTGGRAAAPGLPNLADEFASYPIVDEGGNSIDFINLPPAGKKIFLEQWRAQAIDKIVENGLVYPEMLADIQINDEALRETIADASRGLVENFSECLAGNIEKRSTSFESRSRALTALAPSAPSRGQGGALSALQAYFRNGRIMFTSGKSSSASLWNFGHTTICANSATGYWQSAWEADPWGSRIAVSSWGMDSGYAIGYTDPGDIWMPDVSAKPGVGNESLAYWLNMVGSVPNTTMSIHKNGVKYWVWNWFNSHYEINEASKAEGQAAADIANSKRGLPYNMLVVNKYREDCYYCSSLTWRAWYSVNSKFDYDSWGADTWVDPSNVINDDDVKMLTQANN